jgi:2-iminobutanoate/2-iminopropanoate deaminase
MRRSFVARLALAMVLARLSPAAEANSIRPQGIRSGGSWSRGVIVDGTLYVSGMSGEDARGNIPSDFDAEARQAFANIGEALEKAGMSLADVVSVQLYITDVANFERINAVYTAYFNEPRPTRTTVVAARLMRSGHVEIAATARK